MRRGGIRGGRNFVEEVMVNRIDRKYGRRRKLDALIRQEIEKSDKSKSEKEKAA